MSYVGCGQGEYIQETTYKYVGCGGDFDVARPRRDFTCIISSLCLLSLLLLIPLLMWLLCPTTSLPYDCYEGSTWEAEWPQEKKDYCCMTMGRACPTTRPTTALPETTPTVAPTPFPTPPPTPPITPAGPVDPFNCAVDLESTWASDKKEWCCRIHSIGCPSTQPPFVPPMIVPTTFPAVPADPFDCAAGFANWQSGWSVAKKQWCCEHHHRGCPGSGGCVTSATTSPPFDCNAGFANWMNGWSIAKKAWCCANAGKACPAQGGGCA